MSSSPNKTIQTALIAWQDIVTGAVAFSSVLDCTTKWGASFGVRVARQSATAFTAGWPNIRIEASYVASGNDHWIPLVPLQPPIGGSIGKTTLNGALLAGATTLVLTSATSFVQGDLIWIGDTSTSNYEIVRCKTISGTTITFEEACTSPHANGANVSNQAYVTCPAIDLSPYERIRVVIDNANSGTTISVEVTVITFDSFN